MTAPSACPTALLLTLSDDIHAAWRSTLERRFWRVSFRRPSWARSETLRTESPDLVVIGVRDAEADDAFLLAERLRSWAPTVPIWLSPLLGSETLAVRALRAGCLDYLPIRALSHEVDAALARLTVCREHGKLTRHITDPLTRRAELVGASPGMIAVREQIARVAACENPVLLTGETGTGKDLVAEMIQRGGQRRDRPFVKINCAAIPESLFESEVFGYERGAFTGAQARRDGALLAAHGGTVFLDEVAELSHSAQAKLLRVIESGEISRLGGHEPHPLDVRFIAATNRINGGWVAEPGMRPDLFFRLSVTRIHLQALRERREDVAPLAIHLARRIADRTGVEAPLLAVEVLSLLLQYDWPGNVRELRNVIESAFLQHHGKTIELRDLPDGFVAAAGRSAGAPACERDRMLAALTETEWNMSLAAERLHWSRMTLYRKLARHQVKRPGR